MQIDYPSSVAAKLLLRFDNFTCLRYCKFIDLVARKLFLVPGGKIMDKRKLFALLSFSLMCLAGPGLTYGTDYYVNGISGDDNNICNAPSSPCQTIKKAVSFFDAAPGTGKVRISTGSYTEENIPLPIDPSTRNDITIEGGWNSDFSSQDCDSTATVIIPGFTANSSWHTLFYVWIDNSDDVAFTLRCMSLQKTALGDINQAISVSTHDQGQGIIVFENLRVTGFTNPPVFSLSSADSGQIDATLDHVVIAQNIKSNDGTIFSAVSSGPGTSLVTVKIQDSQIINNGSADYNNTALNFYSGNTGSLDATIKNTLIASNSTKYGSALSVFSTDSGSSSNLSIINSTIVDNNIGSLAYSAGIGADSRNFAEINITMKNTILTGNHYLGVSKDLYLTETNGTPNGQTSFSGNYNIIGQYGESGSPTYTSNNELNVDPLLDNSHHLRSGSPAIDSGQCGYLLLTYRRVAPYTDIDGDERPGYGEYWGCDIGADEYRSFPWPLFLPAITTN